MDRFMHVRKHFFRLSAVYIYIPQPSILASAPNKHFIGRSELPSSPVERGSVFCPQMLENQMEVRKKEIEELQSQAQALSQEGESPDEVDSKRLTVQTKFMELLEPLNERKHNLLASKEIHQFNRDVEDEIVSRPSCAPPGLASLEPVFRPRAGSHRGLVGEPSFQGRRPVHSEGPFPAHMKCNSMFLSSFYKDILECLFFFF